MGTKYASLHIVAGTSNDLMEQLERYYNNPNRKDINSDRYPDYVKEILADKLDLVRNLLDSARQSFKLILIKDEFISIYDEEFSLETIELEGINLSKYIDKPIMAVGNFDDDVFSVILIENGNIITKHTIGDGFDFYDFEPSRLDLDKFETVTKLIVDKEKMIDLINNKDVFEVEEEFSELFKIFLDLDHDDLKSNKKFFKKIDKTKAYTLFKFVEN